MSGETEVGRKLCDCTCKTEWDGKEMGGKAEWGRH